MSGNSDHERGPGGSNSLSGPGGLPPGAGKMFPMDLAVTPQKITIVKSAGTAGDNKLHLVTPQGKPHLLSHAGPISLVRPGSQIISQGVANQQPQMIVSGTQLIPGTQIVNQSSQIIGQSQMIGSSNQILPPQTIISQSSQIINPGTQVINHSSQISQSQITHGNQMSHGTITHGSQMNQSSQIITSGSHVITQGSQLIGQGGQIISQGSQIVSQSSQIISQANQMSQSRCGPSQVLSVGGSMSGSGDVVVSSSAGIRTLPGSMRVLPPSTLSSPRPVVSTVTVSQLNAALSGKGPTQTQGVSSHVPRGPAAGASLAVPRAIARPVAPAPATLNVSTISGWGSRPSVRGPALVYPARAVPRPPPRASPPVPSAAVSVALVAHPQQQTNVITTATVANSGVVTSLPRAPVPRPSLRAAAPAPLAPAPRPVPAQPVRPTTPIAARPTQIPVLQRNFQQAKVVSMGTPPSVQRSALYYEVTKTNVPVTSHHTVVSAHHPAVTTHHSTVTTHHAAVTTHHAPVMAHHAPFTYSHANIVQHSLPAVSMTVVQAPSAESVSVSPPSPLPERPPAPAPHILSTPVSVLPRPSILRKRDVEISPSKSIGALTTYCVDSWPARLAERGAGAAPGDGEGGSTTESAASSPGPDDEPPSPPRPLTPHDISPRKKPRKQMFNSEVRDCEVPNDEPPPSPPLPVPPPPRRSMLGAGWVCGYRATALHFTRPSEVRRKETKPPHVLEIANQKNVLTKANGWKVHHLTAQMDDLAELESDSCDQLSDILRMFDSTNAPHLDSIMELVKGNIQRSKIVCEDMREARADILRVFTHRTLVADILARQADKRCFRKHRNNHT